MIIAVFVKAPIRGQVKSRIAASAGSEAALSLYRCFVLDMLDTVRNTGHPVLVFVTPGDRIGDVRTWLGQDLRYRPQEGADLGERMERAFRAIFTEGAARAVLIGSDIPDLPADVLLEARDALGQHDAVIGPAQDGGYYLIGFRRDTFMPDIFRGVPWSGPDVLDRTMRVLRRRAMRVHTLRTWRDVDTVEDLGDLLHRNRDTAFASSRTMRYAAEMRNMPTDGKAPHGEI